MKLTFIGACQEVTGSCYLLEIANKKILVDCGIWQGSRFTEDRNYNPFPFDPKTLDYVLLTHAHLDHCGRIPKLYKDGFRGQIISTNATLDFAALMLEDSAHIIFEDAKDGGYPPLYTEADAKNCTTLFNGHNYQEIINITDNIKCRFNDAGHILGSSIIEVWAENKKIVFSGDLGNPPVPILNPTEFIDEADYVVIESTYGGKIHEDARTKLLVVSSAIYEAVTMHGVLMIPAFAMERTQELLYELNKLIENKDVPSVPVFVDSPLAIKATEIFSKHKYLFNAEAQAKIKSGDDIFDFPGLVMTETTMESKKINLEKAPKIIIAGSGMCHGGRIRHHLKRYLGDFKNQVLIVGYQVSGSLGRQLLDHEKKVRIEGSEINVAAKIRAVGAYSAHADQPKLINWLEQFSKKPKKIFITHGEMENATALADVIKQKMNIATEIPESNYSIEL
ncbi:MAG: MBL fold metallo-hydrolase [Patescibacteria group bacterium]